MAKKKNQTKTTAKEIKSTKKSYDSAKQRLHYWGNQAKGTPKGSLDRSLYNSVKKDYHFFGDLLKGLKQDKLKEKKVDVVRASKRNARRKKHAREVDEAKTGPIATDMRYIQNPEKYDYPGVDTKKEK